MRKRFCGARPVCRQLGERFVNLPLARGTSSTSHVAQRKVGKFGVTLHFAVDQRKPNARIAPFHPGARSELFKRKSATQKRIGITRMPPPHFVSSRSFKGNRLVNLSRRRTFATASDGEREEWIEANNANQAFFPLSRACKDRPISRTRRGRQSVCPAHVVVRECGC